MPKKEKKAERTKTIKGGNRQGDNEKSRAWAFTLYNYHDDYNNIIENLKVCKYYIIGKEICPDTGKEHLQCYAYFNNAISRISLQKKLNDFTAHCEIAQGNAEQNKKYCSKENNFIEYGTLPKQGERNDLKVLTDKIIKNEESVENILLNEPMTYHIYGRTLEKIEAIKFNKNFRKIHTKGVWIYGPSGFGKSHIAFNNFNPDTHYTFNLYDNGFWNGYKQQETVIINEFRGQIPYSELLDLLDNTVKTVKRKCLDPINFTSKIIIITSCSHPREVYTNVNNKNDSINQLLRRIEVIHLNEHWSKREKEINISYDNLNIGNEFMGRERNLVINSVKNSQLINDNETLSGEYFNENIN